MNSDPNQLPCQEHKTRLDAIDDQTEQMAKDLREIRDALLGNREWERPGLVHRFDRVEKAVQDLTETKGRAVWLLLALGGIAGAIGGWVKAAAVAFFKN